MAVVTTSSFFPRKLFRRKLVDCGETSTELNRVLSTVDLTMLGIGSTLGIGIYVLAGQVAKHSAGPGVVLSFFVAAFASVLAGLCYAEFGARVPKAGSAYVYSYVCVGELIAFVVGWNLIMEYVIGVASVAKGYSGYVDSLTNDHAMRRAFESIYFIDVPFLAHSFDFFAFGITMVLTFILGFGVKESSLFNNIFTSLNLVVVVFVIIAGALYSNVSYWTFTKDEIDEKWQTCANPAFNMTTVFSNETLSRVARHVSSIGSTTSSALVERAKEVGVGGFAPFGIAGIMKGAATCFYGFVGFDCIATTGEEAKNPQRAIPLAIVFSLCFIFMAYFGISTVLTMMVPYFCQDADAPLPFAFEFVGFDVGKWFVRVGALFGLSTSLLGAMFPMPRVIYAMASDGLLFGFLAKVHPRFQTPLVATLIGGTFGGLMAALFNLDALIDMMSIGTLTAYTLVAVCVLILRYRKDEDGADDTVDIAEREMKSTSDLCHVAFNGDRLGCPNETTSKYTQWVVFSYCILTMGFCATIIYGLHLLMAENPAMILLAIVLLTGMLLCLLTLQYQPSSRKSLTFKVPLVPWIPGFSILANIYLIMQLSDQTWVRFAVWMFLGFIIYGACLFSGRTDSVYHKAFEAYTARRQGTNVATTVSPSERLHSDILPGSLNGNGYKK